MATEYVAQAGHVIVSPDLPVDVTRESGLYLPAPKKADHSERDEDGYIKAFAKGEFQIVSGTVVGTCGTAEFPATMPTVEAERLGIRHEMIQNGVSQCFMKMSPPVVGDRVWFGYRTWSSLEAAGKVAFDGDAMLGKMSVGKIYLVGSGGSFRAPGPYVVCEPIPQTVVDGGPVHGQLSHVRNAGIARFVGEVSHVPHCAGLSEGDCISFGGRDKHGCPVPFSQSDWMRVDARLVSAVNPSWVDVPADLSAAWDAVAAKNRELARIASGNASGTRQVNMLYDVDWNEVDYLAELEKKRVAKFKKMYRSKWF